MKAPRTIVVFVSIFVSLACGACSRESGELPPPIGPAKGDYADASDAGVALPAPSASTSPADLATAQALFDEGRKLMSEGKTAEACPKFEQSVQIDPADGALLNLARCEELLGDVPKACASYAAAWKSLHAKTPAQLDREKLVSDRMAALKCSK